MLMGGRVFLGDLFFEFVRLADIALTSNVIVGATACALVELLECDRPWSACGVRELLFGNNDVMFSAAHF